MERRSRLPIKPPAERRQHAREMFAGIRVAEIAGSDAGAWCAQLLGDAGAERLVIAGRATKDAARGARRDELIELALARCDVLIRPAWCSPRGITSRHVDVVGPPSEREREAGQARSNAEVWAAALAGSSMAIAAVVGLLGADHSTVDATLQSLLAGALFPMPEGIATAAVEQPVSPGRWPRARVMQAADGWLVTGPTRLPVATLAGLVGGGADSSRAEAEAAVAAWVRGVPHACAVETLQQWRTSFVSVLPGHVSASLAGPGRDSDGRSAAAGTVAGWLDITAHEAERLLEADLVSVGV